MAKSNEDDHRSNESSLMSGDEIEERPNDYETTMTECLGFESLNIETAQCGLELEEVQEQRSSSRSITLRRTETVTSYPPFLSSLKKNGRPRFNLVKQRGNGRLQISSVKNERPEVLVVRTPPADEDEESGRVRIKLINGENDGYSDSEINEAPEQLASVDGFSDFSDLLQFPCCRY